MGTQRGLLELAGSVLEELDLDVVLDRALASARELTGAQYAAIGLLDASRLELERFVTVGMTKGRARRSVRCREAVGCSET